MMEKCSEFSYIHENLNEIEDRASKAAVKSGRNPAEIKILGATKTVSAEKINYAISKGLKLIGENRVQELTSKWEDIDKERCESHFIGTLQTNKIKYILDKVSLIHSISNIRQVKEISRLLNGTQSQMKVLVEVNVGNEQSKSGVLFEELHEFLHEISEIPHIKVEGLMCIPPIYEEKEKLFSYFSQIHKYYVDIGAKKIDNISMSILSMGMSDDYEEAILAGANLIRVGSALFGNRLK